MRALGKGGFGSVHLAEVRSPEGLVHRMAVKVLHEDLSSDTELAARSRDEARLMSQLNHDNIVRIYGLTRIAGRSAVLMEYVEGIDCEALIKQARTEGGGVPIRAASRIIECAADALWAAFNAVSPVTQQKLRVVHRDIKPGNILVSSSGLVKVMDFGVARADFEREAETRSLMFGTQRYMAPERWLERECGHRSDVFSLGVAFWELVTGEKFAQVPFAPAHYERRIDACVEQFLEQVRLEGRERESTIHLLRGMLAYRATDRLDASQVREIMGELSELAQGPSLRRYARGRVSELVEIQQAMLLGDKELREFTGTLKTASSASGELLRAPSHSGRLNPADPAAAATIFEAQVLPERGYERLQSGQTKSESSSEKPQEETTAAVEDLEEGSPWAAAVFAVLVASLLLGLIAGLVGSGEDPAGTAPAVEASETVEEVGVLDAEAVETAAAQGLTSERSEPSESVASTGGAAESTASANLRSSGTRAPASVDRVRIKILADPREGVVQVGSLRAPVSESVELPVGEHAFTFEGSDWVASCRKRVDSDVRKIKFVRETGSCVLLR
ncbi:MAG: serine/threonine-protein kinase [Myxococcota bacterium]|nr:serine/threonine-protein kinase [Myxococcota bacterium]